MANSIWIELAKFGGGGSVLLLALYLITKALINRINEKDKTQTDSFAEQNKSYTTTISEITKTFMEYTERQTVARNMETAKTLETIQLMQLEMTRKTVLLNKLVEVQETNNERFLKLETYIQEHYAEIKAKQSQIDAEIKTQFAELALLVGKMLSEKRNG
jgi:hypothetical protein